VATAGGGDGGPGGLGAPEALNVGYGRGSGWSQRSARLTGAAGGFGAVGAIQDFSHAASALTQPAYGLRLGKKSSRKVGPKAHNSEQRGLSFGLRFKTRLVSLKNELASGKILTEQADRQGLIFHLKNR